MNDESSSSPTAEQNSHHCESCGSAPVAVTEVRRVYVTPAAWDTEARVEVANETERWCDACILHYPHQPAEG